MSIFSLGIATAVVVVANSAAAQVDDICATIERELVATSTPSVAVAVAQHGKILWEEGFGWADREKRIPATERTMYSLASISKLIAATGLMVLVERGEIDLDRPLDDYLGDAKINGRAFGASIERASGESYADSMRREVFLPLGLTRMSVHIGPRLDDFTATRYAPDGTPIPFYGFDHPGGSAVFASAHDLVRFGIFHL